MKNKKLLLKKIKMIIDDLDSVWDEFQQLPKLNDSDYEFILKIEDRIANITIPLQDRFFPGWDE